MISLTVWKYAIICANYREDSLAIVCLMPDEASAERRAKTLNDDTDSLGYYYVEEVGK